MAGVTLRLLNRTKYQFNDALSTTSSKVLIIPLVQNIDVAGYTQGTLLVRIHGVSIPASGPTIEFGLRTTAPTEEDPNSSYDSTVDLVTKPSVTSNTTTGLLAPASYTSGAGGLVSLFMQVTTGTAVAASLYVIVSVDLVLKS
jgi:hypothetical protein